MSNRNLQQTPNSSLLKSRNRNNNNLNESQPTASPIKYLLQNNIKFNENREGDRGEAEIQLINRLLCECKIFKDLDISLQDAQIRRQLCQSVVLIYCQSPHIMDIKDNQLFVFFEGQGFQYMQNNFQNQYRKQYKIYDNSQYLMLRKLSTNDYFLVTQQHNVRYHANQKKYQLMVDQNTLLGKISDEIFYKLFYQKIIERQKNIISFLKKVEIFNGLPNSFFIQFSKFLVDETRKQNDKIISKQQKSKYVYFIKQGNIEVHNFNEQRVKSPTHKNTNYYLANVKPFTQQKLGPFQSFGMDHLDMLETLVDKEVICSTDCHLYKIQKRLLAIIITSFQMEFQQKTKVWSEVNINSQIKGQNYCSPQKQLLLKNAQRIRTSQKKARDLKLRFFASNKSKKEQQSSQKLIRQKSNRQTILQEHVQIVKSRMLSPEQKRRMIKTEDGRFRTGSLIKFINTTGGLLQETKFDTIKRYIQNNSGLSQIQQKKVSQIQLTTLQDQDTKVSPLLRFSNAFQYKGKLQSQKFTRAVSQMQRSKSLVKFVPKIQPKLNNYNSNNFNTRHNSDIIGVFLDKKIKNQIVKKAEKVLNQNRNLKLVQNKNLKRLFSVKDCKLISGMSDQDKKSIAQDIVERMSNLRQNPLLLQIQGQRRKLQRQMKLVERNTKPIISDSPRKYKKQDQMILIKNHQE